MDNNELVIVKESRRGDGVAFYAALVRIHASISFLHVFI